MGISAIKTGENQWEIHTPSIDVCGNALILYVYKLECCLLFTDKGQLYASSILCDIPIDDINIIPRRGKELIWRIPLDIADMETHVEAYVNLIKQILSMLEKRYMQKQIQS